jgi:glycosyltransferase involved in cell wall biosynthesis
MHTWPIHVVPYALDVDVFCPLERRSARNAFDLPPEKKIILFGAVGKHTDKRKGFDLLVEALSRLDNRQEEYIGLIFGQSEPQHIPKVGFPLSWVGYIEDDSLLASLYSAADVMVVPSRQEALGQTASEAQACGTPVVAFAATGLKDVVVHRKTGYLAEAFSTDDLARGLSWILEDEQRRAAIGQAARFRAVECWHPSVTAAQYRAVYQQAVEQFPG